MREHFEKAVDNVAHVGDTDVFPFPVENHIFSDKREEVINLLLEMHGKFEDFRSQMPPFREEALALVGYTGFRKATAIDPIWNLYLLGLTVSMAERIEDLRRSLPTEAIYSYRYSWDDDSKLLFKRDEWTTYRERSVELAQHHSHVLVTDIADFYPRIYHHRLRNELRRLGGGTDTPRRIMALLNDFSINTSYGLPVGGPAARLLAELALNAPDRLLVGEDLTFCRYADDYHIFTDSVEGCYGALIRLSEILAVEGLSLQKSKTRILTASEFLRSSLLTQGDDDADGVEEGATSPADTGRRSFLKLSLRYDPYSPTAADDYERLRQEINRFDLFGMLAEELQKSRVHVALTRRLVRAVRFLDPAVRGEAALAVTGSLHTLAPLFPSVMIALRELLPELDEETQATISETVLKLVQERSYLTKIDLNLAFALRLLSLKYSAENERLCMRIFQESHSAFVRRDIILMMARWNNTPWLSERKGRFLELRGPERRAFIIASYVLGDEGSHWRDNTKDEFNELELLVRDWASDKVQVNDWEIPL